MNKTKSLLLAAGMVLAFTGCGEHSLDDMLDDIFGEASSSSEVSSSSSSSDGGSSSSGGGGSSSSGGGGTGGGGVYKPGTYLLTTTWNQSSPYWNQTPTIGGRHAFTGCHATAIAQIMNYHKWPRTTETIPAYTSDREGITIQIPALPPVTFDWNNMSDRYTATSTEAQKDAVATLMSAAGRSVGMKYTIESSGSVPLNGITSSFNAFPTYFDYDYKIKLIKREDYTDSDWERIIKDQIDQNLPVLYRGQSSLSSSDDDFGSHAFVIDGYDASDKFHVNWGWGGTSDGFYALTMNSTEGLNPPNKNYTFSYDQRAIINIKSGGTSPGNKLLKAARNGGTYALEADISGDDKIKFQLDIKNDFTLDLNGHKLEIEVSTSRENGIKILSGKTLTIKDSKSGGVLDVIHTSSTYYSGGGGGAAINTTDGTIIIESGTVNATGGAAAAGIGGGAFGSGSTIIIKGGTVNATGNSGGAGIGGGYQGSNGGNITISGGIVTATGNGTGAGIGGGREGSGGTITITDGTVTATGGTNGAGIGGGYHGDGGTIIIKGGTVTATGGTGAGGGSGAGIGGGSYGAGGKIIITGGTVKAKGGTFAKNIGSGKLTVEKDEVEIGPGAVIL